jgi:hypothetical protein
MPEDRQTRQENRHPVHCHPPRRQRSGEQATELEDKATVHLLVADELVAGIVERGITGTLARRRRISARATRAKRVGDRARQTFDCGAFLRRRIVEERKESVSPASSRTTNPIDRPAVSGDTSGLRRSDLQRTEQT